MTTEQWRRVPSSPDYLVSSHGRVASFNPRWKRPRFLRGHVATNGYRMVYVGKVRTLHGVVAEAFHGPRPDGMQIRHLDGDKTNNRASNLTYGTASENAIDSVEHGVHPNASKVECIRGHAFDERNTYITPIGTRGCRQCRAWHARELRTRRALAAAGIRTAA